MQMNKKVLVIGAGGRVGYPFAKYCAWKGFETYGYDRNPQSFEIAKTYQEENVPNVEFHKLTEGMAYRSLLTYCDIVVIMIGTPIDGEGNPRCDGLFAIRDEIVDSLQYRKKDAPLLIVLRSTVSPGITSQFREHIQNALNAYHPEIFVAFCPERIAQGHTFTELASIPQIIGCLEMDEFLTAAEFFCALGCECIRMKDVEAELGKLMTNMYRYVNFALANEFAMIADHHGADYEHIRKSINKDYPRMDLAKAGPNSAGPCLFKDGQFLVSHIPYNELIRSAFAINEGMPEWIVSKIEAYQNDRLVPFKQVGIMGMSFKANNDDTRYSLSFKLKKILERKGYRVVCSDPYIKEYAENDLYGCDVVVVMTPHSYFDKLSYRASIASGTLVIDLWRHFEASKHNGLNGVFIKHGVV